MDLEAVGLVVVDQLLRLHDERAAFVDVEFLALLLSQFVERGIVVADEVVAVGRIGRDEQIVGQFVRVAALRPAHHLPGGRVPPLALIPDDLVVLLARQRAHVHRKPQLAPGIGDDLRRLVLLRRGGLGLGQQCDRADGVAGVLCRRGKTGQHGHGTKQE